MTLKEKAFEDIVEKGENAGNQLLLFQKQVLIFHFKFIFHLQILSIWTQNQTTKF